jgi:hypothetical protein
MVSPPYASEHAPEEVIWKKNHPCILKGKAIPLQAWTGPEGSRRLRLPDFKTFGT